ncbi:X-ray radiation resistance-associated protein 1-like [Anneissia japonica]|uniref:X-ray radiation resistance-associated protein 1-like n=1 Tax=Anneissia japonica TaxID=1529436 RepID=UPI00142563F8|nr:X-ray radiation resistance-associated protein 1-like [Anneissia japonica]
MAVPAGVKLDEGTGYFVGNCFPVRTILKGVDEASGAWYVAHKADQRRTFQALLCPQPKTYEQIKKERKEKELKEKRKGSPQTVSEDGVTDGLLDGFFLMKHCAVEDPSDLCSVNVAGQSLTEVKAADFSLFDNVAYVNAGENLLSLESFNQFPILRELELPLNAIRNIKVQFEDFPYLEVLDVSYNNLSSDDVLKLGVLPKLKVLYLTGNQIRSLPVEMAHPYSVEVENSQPALLPRFGNLEILFLDDNNLTDITTFASLAGLKKLKRLNLDKNDIYSIPHLRASSKTGFDSEVSSQASTPKSGKRRPRSGRLSSRGGSNTPTKSKNIDDDQDDQADDIALKIQLPKSPPPDFPPPFPELEYLSLAFNKISEEEGLLAVAAWPLLSELIISDNPLTTHRSGDPPLLKRYLSDRLGIQMVRKKTTQPSKPTVKVPIKSHRKVTEVARPLPKRPVEFMLEAPKPQPALPEPRPPSRQGSPFDSKPLPPISDKSAAKPKTKPAQATECEEIFDDKADQTRSWTEETFGRQKDVEDDLKNDVSSDNPVFLTQVDDQEEEKQTEKVAIKQTSEKNKTKKKKRIDSAAKSLDVPNKFKGFESLLDAEDDPDVHVMLDVQSNLRSLRLALKQETHYQNTVNLDKIQKPFEPYKKSQPPTKPPHKNRAQKVETILEDMKERILLTEENLQHVLDDKKKMHREYPEVVQLLNEIQSKYSAVRAQSMKDTKERQRGVQESLQAIEGIGNKMKEYSL